MAGDFSEVFADLGESLQYLPPGEGAAINFTGIFGFADNASEQGGLVGDFAKVSARRSQFTVLPKRAGGIVRYPGTANEAVYQITAVRINGPLVEITCSGASRPAVQR